MAFEDWHGYIFTSVSKFLLEQAEADSVECVVEMANHITPEWENAASNVEITLDGPRMFPLSEGAYRAELDAFVIVSSLRSDNDIDHVRLVGKISDWLDQCVLVLDYGDTGTIEIGQMKPDNGEDGISPINLKPARTDDRLHSTITAAYNGRFNE